MHPIPDHAPLFLIATAIAAKRRPAEPAEIIAAIDLLQVPVPGADRLADTVLQLSRSGLITVADNGIALTPAAQALVEALPGGKADHAQRSFELRAALGDYVATECPAVTQEAALWQAAIAEHAAAAQSPAKNLLMPKPAPTQARPGQRQRKPMGKAMGKAKPRKR